MFLAGELAYKVKKPVRFPFLDYSTLERRRHFCEEDVRLNADLAPGVYRRVVDIAGDPPRIDGAGEPIEVAVEMERLPADRMLDVGHLPFPTEKIAALLLDFHRRARRTDEYGRPDLVLSTILGNLDVSRAHLPPFLVDFLDAGFRRFVEEHRAEMEARIAAGRVREGHGDLHAGNICVLDDRIVIYDRIEFSEKLRCGDVAADLAFLLMDLEHRGRHDEAAELERLYDPAMGPIASFFKAHRALVRGAVGFLRGAQTDGPVDDAVRYCVQAATYLLPPVLVLTCGLPGTGKSSRARALAAPLRAAVLRSDLVRKRLAGMDPTEHWAGSFHEGPYHPDMTRRTYETLLGEAGRILRGGRGVIVDATFSKRAWRERFRACAAAHGAAFAILHTDVPAETVRARLERRRRDAAEVSDADFEVYRGFAKSFEAPEGADVVTDDGQATDTALLMGLMARWLGA